MYAVGLDVQTTTIKEIRPLLKRAYGWDIKKKGAGMKAHRDAAGIIVQRLLAQQTLQGKWLLQTVAVRTYMWLGELYA
jgi:hypothetical protein